MNSEAVTTSHHPSQYHDSNTSFNSNATNRITVPQSVDSEYGTSNQRSPIMVSSCGQQQRMVENANIYGQPSDQSSGYGHLPSASYGQHGVKCTHSGHLIPDKRNCSVFSLQNERYRLDAPSYKDHDHDDEFIIYANKYSLCMCVFDGHDGSRAVKFVQKYMKGNIFDTKSWMKLSEFNRHEEIESALAEFIRVTEKDFFKNIKTYIDEKVYLQSQIPKVSYYHYQVVTLE